MIPNEGLAGIRTSMSRNIHSLPPTHRSPYLERHILAKQKERLEKEIALFEHKCSQCRRHLADIEVQLEALAQHEKAPKPSPSLPAGSETVARRLATMTVEY